MDLHTNDSSESAAGVFVSDKCQIPVGGIPQQEPDRQQYYMALCRQKVQEISDKLGRPLTCFISTFGCQMNAHDSEKLLGILLEAGFVEGTSEESDFVLYNTCTVRENANLRVYGRLGYLHDAVLNQLFNLTDDVLRRTAALASAHIRYDTVAAEIVAAKHDINARLKCIFALRRQILDDLISSFPDIDDHLPRLKALFQQLCQFIYIVRAENQVHKAVALL